ncbi:MAG TPA: LOG family protein [Nitrospira sp.]|nr:LOG family protein [Nitrospira sp.]
MPQPDESGSKPGDFVSLGDEKQVVEVVSASILSLWEAVNNLTRLKPTTRERYRVTIFGSARVPKDHWVYLAVRDLAAELTRLDCDIITGGGPGLMEAANEGARLADPDSATRSTGIRVALPFEQNVNAFVSQTYEHRTFFTRLHQFVIMSDAFVVVPGGIGTVLETMMVWQLLQVRQLQNTPLILAGKMYEDLVAWARTSMLRPDVPLAGPEDLTIPQCVADGPGILRIIRAHHADWVKAKTQRA